MRFIILCLIMLFSLQSNAKERKQHRLILDKVYSYSKQWQDSFPDSIVTNSYSKFRMEIKRRNPSIVTFPHMLPLVRNGERRHLSESYFHSIIYKNRTIKSTRQIHVSTIRKRREALEYLGSYLIPNIYNPTVVDDQILSPMVSANRRYYIYHNRIIDEQFARLEFRPKTKNTQLCRGFAIVERTTGRIESYELSGEYDMISYKIKVAMGNEGVLSICPKDCRLDGKLSYLGNIIYIWANSSYDLPTTLPDSIHDANDRNLMATVRPEPLNSQENAILSEWVEKVRNRFSLPDSLSEDSIMKIGGYLNKQKSVAKYFLWDLVGDNLLNRIKGSFGEDNRGRYRIDPLFNPAYFGYSDSKGVIYKLKVRASYAFTDNSDISTRVKFAYSLKLHRPYLTFPLQYTFNKRRNGYVRFEARTGNRITNSQVLEEVKREPHRDSIDFKKMNLDYFKNSSYRLLANYDLSEKVGLQGGVIYYDRQAADAASFRAVGKAVKHKSFAPIIQLQYRPRGYKGPFLLLDYERGLNKVFGSESEHDRWEFDAYHTLHLDRTRFWYLRGGFGCYSNKGHNQYFLDYENFRRNDVPEGWDDDWSGEFERLDGNWYNAADYYFRAHATYESPLLFLSWIPVVGQIVERERIYVSALALRRLAPYVEVGYGFTNRVFSIGFFSSFDNKGYDGIGFKLGVELFDNWR